MKPSPVSCANTDVVGKITTDEKGDDCTSECLHKFQNFKTIFGIISLEQSNVIHSRNQFAFNKFNNLIFKEKSHLIN